LRKQLADLEADFRAETDALISKSQPASETIETLALRPGKSNISVQLLALAWVPYWSGNEGTFTPASV
jgi:hypothetical protein